MARERVSVYRYEEKGLVLSASKEGTKDWRSSSSNMTEVKSEECIAHVVDGIKQRSSVDQNTY